MNNYWAAIVYALCLLASLACAGLLLRAWLRNRSRLLLWTAISFGFFAVNNLALVADMVFLPSVSLWPLRFAPSLIGLAVLLYGFVWETDQ